MTYFVILSTLLLFGVLLPVYLYLRSVANGVLRVSLEQFHDAISSLLQTPRDLPDGVLLAIKTMNETALHGKTHWRLLRRLIRERKQAASSQKSGQTSLASEIKKMRPELQDLFGKASMVWVSIMCSRSLFVGSLLAIEMARRQISVGRIEPGNTARNEAVKALPDLSAVA